MVGEFAAIVAASLKRKRTTIHVSITYVGKRLRNKSLYELPIALLFAYWHFCDMPNDPENV
jgi:hypothetical protein